MYVERNIEADFKVASRLNKVVIIVGPRQSGKTTFLQHQSGQSNAIYVMFDDPDAKELFDTDIKRFENQYMISGTVTILDEIQYCKEPGSKLKYLADKGRTLWITSSSQVSLSKEIIGWLVGRAAIIKLYPFSLNEFFFSKGLKEITKNILSRSIEEHMLYGGYPNIVIQKGKVDKEFLLKNLYETMVLKDIARTFNISNISALERMAVYLSHNVGNTLLYDKISSDLGSLFPQ